MPYVCALPWQALSHALLGQFSAMQQHEVGLQEHVSLSR